MDKEAQKLAEAWAGFLKVDMTQGIKSVEDSIEDTLTRLDEFTGVIDVLRRETNVEEAVAILAQKPELILLLEKVRKLEKVVAQVKETVLSFEQVVSAAERDLNFHPEGRLLNYIKPLFFKRQAPQPRNAQSPVFTSPPVFSTKDLFS